MTFFAFSICEEILSHWHFRIDITLLVWICTRFFWFRSDGTKGINFFYVSLLLLVLAARSYTLSSVFCFFICLQNIYRLKTEFACYNVMKPPTMPLVICCTRPEGTSRHLCFPLLMYFQAIFSCLGWWFCVSFIPIHLIWYF